MTNQEQCALLQARAALLNATVAMMTAANAHALHEHTTQPFLTEHFAWVIENSGCTKQDTDKLFKS